MVKIDLRPSSVRHRSSGLERLTKLSDVGKRMARMMGPLLVAVLYLRFSTVATSAANVADEASLRHLSLETAEKVKRARQNAEERKRVYEANERARLLNSLLGALEDISISGLSLIELRAEGNSALLEGEVADVPTLQAFSTELGQRLHRVRVSVDSIREEILVGQSKHSRFTVRVVVLELSRDAVAEMDVS